MYDDQILTQVGAKETFSGGGGRGGWIVYYLQLVSQHRSR